jgi:uncharacterized membrane protein YphA (DoxX/SURF4 family)
LYARLALGSAFLSAVADRFGIWGAAGARNIAWGDFGHFLTYTARITPFVPHSLVPAAGWTATLLEVVIGVALIVGIATRAAAIAAGVLLALFACGMTLGTGVKTAFDASVFSASAAAFLLACASSYPVAVENVPNRRSAARMARRGR